MKNTPILVTGGTGFVGSHLLALLLKEGYTRIRATRRAGSDMRLVQDLQDRIEWVETDITDVIGMEEAMSGIRQVYHCAALVSFDPRDRKRLAQTNVQGTATVVNAALAENIDKLVYVSSIAAIGRSSKSNHVTEETKWEAGTLNTAYAKTKYLAEKEVWRGMLEGLTVAIINPSVIIGSGFWNKGSTKLFTKVHSGLRFFPKGATGFVDVRDVVELMHLMMESDVAGRRFIANGTNISYRDVFTQIAKALNVPPPSTPVNDILKEVAWRVDWLRSRLLRTYPLITKETARTAMHSFTYDNLRSIEQFNFRYRPLEKTIAQTCEQLKKAAQNGFYPARLPF